MQNAQAISAGFVQRFPFERLRLRADGFLTSTTDFNKNFFAFGAARLNST
jgi:hypothetical protein